MPSFDRSTFPSDDASFEAIHSFAFRGDPFFARTTNAGASWEPTRNIAVLNQNIFTIGNQISVLPDGTLVDVFNLEKGSGLDKPNFFEAVLRSSDKGLTWSKMPIVVSTESAVPVVDPNTSERVRAGAGLPDMAVDPRSGKLYVVWADGRFSNGAHDDIAFSTSSDGGFTWTAPVKINQTPISVPAFTPTVQVASDGTVAASYYDFRNLPAGDTATLPTDYWLIHCHSSCTNPSNWSESHVAGPFDMKTAPVARGFFVGDYEGMGSLGTSILPFFVQTNSGNLANRTDVFATAAGP